MPDQPSGIFKAVFSALAIMAGVIAVVLVGFLLMGG
jgi:hypothetical protein